MKWFRKKRDQEPRADPDPLSFRERVDAFWAWWSDESQRIYDSVDGDGGAAIQPEVSRAVDQLFPGGMAWVFGPGADGEGHSFTLSPEGDSTKRLLINFWMSKAPALDGWTFYPARQPSEGFAKFQLGIGDVEVGADSIWISPEVNAERESIDIVAWSPVFAKIERNQSLQILFILLDEALGEQGTSRCIGAIDLGDNKLAASIPLAELPDYVEGVFAEHGWSREQGHYNTYELNEPLGDFPRGDIFVGSTQDMRTVGDYFDAGGPFKDPLSDVGLELAFLQLPAAILPDSDQVKFRSEIEDDITGGLKKRDAGIVFGGAMGRDAVYIDVMLFDPSRGRKVIGEVMEARGLGGQYQVFHFTK